VNSMTELPYYNLPNPPENMSAAGLLIRFLDAFGFRYRWATEGLREEDMEFQACDSSMKLWELLAHVHGLISVTDAFITGNEREKIEPISLEERRKKTLEIALRLREALLGLDDEYLGKRLYMVPWAEKEYPLWYLINGPLSDALTHVGQIASWRRINGNPIPGANVFYGTPPKE
jgi:hypothetical protein